MRKTRKGLVTKCEIVTEIDVNNRVKTGTCPGKFRPVSKLLKHSLTSTNSNDIHSHSENSTKLLLQLQKPVPNTLPLPSQIPLSEHILPK